MISNRQEDRNQRSAISSEKLLKETSRRDKEEFRASLNRVLPRLLVKNLHKVLRNGGSTGNRKGIGNWNSKN